MYSEPLPVDEKILADKSQLDLAALQYFPNYPSVGSDYDVVYDCTQDKDICVKPALQRHESLLPGTFLLCCPHGIALGFLIMLQHEGPSVPYRVVHCHMSDVAVKPRVIIYDNACNLQRYIAGREPSLLKSTM